MLVPAASEVRVATTLEAAGAVVHHDGRARRRCRRWMSRTTVAGPLSRAAARRHGHRPPSASRPRPALDPQRPEHGGGGTSPSLFLPTTLARPRRAVWAALSPGVRTHRVGPTAVRRRAPHAGMAHRLAHRLHHQGRDQAHGLGGRCSRHQRRRMRHQRAIAVSVPATPAIRMPTRLSRPTRL